MKTVYTTNNLLPYHNFYNTNLQLIEMGQSTNQVSLSMWQMHQPLFQ